MMEAPSRDAEELPPVAENPEHQSLVGQLYLAGAIGPSPAMPRHIDGRSPQPRAGRSSRTPPAHPSCSPGRLEASYIDSPWWSLLPFLGFLR